MDNASFAASRRTDSAHRELTGLRKNLPYVDLRIGLASGDVIVGNIGAENSRSYTVIYGAYFISTYRLPEAVARIRRGARQQEPLHYFS